MKCYRCHSELKLTNPDDPRDIEFYICLGCNFRYSRKIGQEIHDAWMTPLTYILYAVLFDAEPTSRAQAVADGLKNNPKVNLDLIRGFILDELEDPKQKVSEILNFAYPDEVKLREFMRLVYKYTEEY